MRASQIVAVALVAGALLMAVGAHAWLQSSEAESGAAQANIRGSVPGKDMVPAALSEAATPGQPPLPTMLPVTAASAPVSPTPTPTDSAAPAAVEPAAANSASLEARMAEAASEAAHRTERFRHSRRDDGQHAE